MSLCFWGLEARFCPQNGPFKKPCPEPIAISFPGTRGTSQDARDRYGIIDHECLAQSLGFDGVPAFQKQHRQWIDEALSENIVAHESKWSQSIAVGSEAFVNQIVDTLSPKVGQREIAAVGNSFVVREASVPYSPHFDSKMELLRPQNTLAWSLNSESQTTC